MSRSLSLLLAVVGLFCAGSGLWFGAIESELRVGRELEKFPRLSATPFFRCADSYYWISYAREMIETGKWRVRATQMDNAPYGRRNWGWASLNVWYLVALAKVWSLAANLTPGQALLPAALWSNPILYGVALFAILITGLTTGRFPAAAAAAFVFAVSPRIYGDFSFALPGHHGWHDLACFAALVSLAAGIRKKSPRWFAFAGLASAIALWIGATQQAFGLAAAGLGALLGMIVRLRRSPATRDAADSCSPGSWRFFGSTAAVAALFFYFLEYAPGPFAMRLEVNHPIYALSFLLGGEFLCRAQRLLGPTKARHAVDFAALLITGAGLAAIAAAILLGPAEWHAMRQPLMQRLHHEIAEFQPVTRWYPDEWWLVIGAPSAVLAAAFWRIFDRRLTTENRTALLVCALPCLVAIGLSFVQLRWAGIAGASAAALAAVLFADFPMPAAEQSPRGWRGVPLAETLSLCFSLGVILCWTARHHAETVGEIRDRVIDRLATMEVASRLQSDSRSAHPVTVFSDQKERQAWVDYTMGIRSLGSLYWDNPAGVRDEARFLGSADDPMAHRIARERGIQFVVLTPNAGSVVAYHYIWQGTRTSSSIRDTLAYRLAAPQPRPPDWLQLLPTTTPAMTREKIRIYRVL